MTVNILFFSRKNGRRCGELNAELNVKFTPLPNSNIVPIAPERLRSLGVKLPKNVDYVVEVV